MKVKHLKTKTTIELTPEELHDWISRVNTLENITDNIREMNDIYLSDVNSLNLILYRLTDLLKLKWNRDKYTYIKGDNE
tara:strand:+ start:181 stop:417 length:237 start_codon:yes stop_codon:yes gene_type:complete